MFGMNDVGRSSYDEVITPAKLKARDGHLASFRRNYARLLDECDEAWPKVRALAKPVPHKYVLRKIENGK